MTLKLKKLLMEIAGMCPAARGALAGTLKLSCAMLLCALAILLRIGAVDTGNYHLYITALEMAKTPAGLLLIAAIGTVLIEEQARL